ncbi:MAG TPA: radical SAM family heme chaperone HemW [Planctomycetota bacterium]|nr:radical SAM family heme chaperone HemW [Planctomycetota bacterium]
MGTETVLNNHELAKGAAARGAPLGWPVWLRERARAAARTGTGAGAGADAGLTRIEFPALQALYVHVPFCAAICSYCDFAREIAKPERIERYLAAVAREVSLTIPAGFAPDTVFFGGGTPSILDAGQWRRLMSSLAARVDFSRAREVTIECNPGTLENGKMTAWLETGVNRISFGAQSFDPAMLANLGRIHTREEIPAGVERARAAGLTNASIDLIYGLPGQSVADFGETLEIAAALPVEHLSAYALTYEPGTPFHVMLGQGQIAACSEDDTGAMYRLAMERLGQRGFVQYEISNYSRGPERAAVHNLVYWHRGVCRAVGPSASGFMDGRRTVNERDLTKYCSALEAGRAPVASEEVLEPAAAVGEAFVLELRLNEGVDLRRFAVQFGIDPTATRGTQIDLWQRLGLMEFVPGELLRLTDAGRPVADAMLCEFVEC